MITPRLIQLIQRKTIFPFAILFFIVLGILVSGQAKAASPAVVQTCNNGWYTGSYNNTSTCTFSSNVTAGDVLLDFSGWNTSIPTTTLISGCATSWNLMATSSAYTYPEAILMGTVASTGPCTLVAYEGPNNQDYFLSAYDLAGVSPSQDGYNLNGGYYGSSYVGPNVTTTIPGDLAITWLATTQNSTTTDAISTPPNFTQDFYFNGGNSPPTIGAHLLLTGTTSTAGVNVTLNPGGYHVQGITVALPSASSLPFISSFSASPSEVLSNGTTTLSWSVSNATSLSISPAIGTVTGTSITTPALTTTTLYTLTAANANGTTTATTSIAIDFTPPTQPTNLSATAESTSSVQLIWTASTDNGGPGIGGYDVLRCTGSSCTPQSTIATSSFASYTDNSVTAGATYTYAIQAYDTLAWISTAKS